jgi:hypothetical protein
VQFGDLLANRAHDSKSIYIPTQERGNELKYRDSIQKLNFAIFLQEDMK